LLQRNIFLTPAQLEDACSDDQGEIRRNDWLKTSRFCMSSAWTSRLWDFSSQSQRRISPWSSNHGISPDERWQCEWWWWWL